MADQIDPAFAAFMRALDGDSLGVTITLLQHLAHARATITNLRSQVDCQARLIEHYHALAYGTGGAPSMSTATLDIGFSRKNTEGYLDLTSYHALKKLQRELFGYRPLVYMCSPFSGDTKVNLELARRFCAHAVGQRKIPFAPHLHYPQFMDDADPDHWELAMFFNRVLLAKCEALWACVGHVSPGMRLEIGWARDLDLPIKFFDSDFKEVTP